MNFFVDTSIFVDCLRKNVVPYSKRFLDSVGDEHVGFTSSITVAELSVGAYIQKIKRRDENLAKGWVQIVNTLAVDTTDGMQKMNCVNTEGAFRIIQSIHKKKRI